MRRGTRSTGPWLDNGSVGSPPRYSVLRVASTYGPRDPSLPNFAGRTRGDDLIYMHPLSLDLDDISSSLLPPLLALHASIRHGVAGLSICPLVQNPDRRLPPVHRSLCSGCQCSFQRPE